MTVEEGALKLLCETNQIDFTRVMFKYQHGRKFIVNQHHTQITDNLDKTITGDLTRLIINTPPRYSKTELLKNYIARGLALNPRAKFLYLSYSDDLALDASEAVKEIINLEIYQKLWDVRIKHGSNSKRKWYTEQGGGMYSVSTKGQVTGFGAGLVDSAESAEVDELIKDIYKFGGAIIIDDPIKPEDAIESPRIRNRINERFNNTIKSRTNSRKTPIILIMQRLHQNDLTGFLLDGGSGEDWTCIVQKAIKDDGTALWNNKHTIEELNQIRLASEFVFESQYMQNPKPLEGLAFPTNELSYFKSADLIGKTPDFIYSFADVANGGGDYYSMPILYGFLGNRDVECYLVDCIYTKKDNRFYEPETIKKMNQHKIAIHVVETNNMGMIHLRHLKDNKMNSTKLLGLPSKGNKDIRISLQTAFIIDKVKFLHKSEYQIGSDYYNFMHDLTEFRFNVNNENDDSPDSLAGLSLFVRKKHNLH